MLLGKNGFEGIRKLEWHASLGGGKDLLEGFQVNKEVISRLDRIPSPDFKVPFAACGIRLSNL